jgi:tyrosine aminotransferase
VLVRAVVEATESFKHNGYVSSTGTPAARAAVAAAYSAPGAPPLRADDVVLASGGSGALDLALSALLSAGDTLLVPRPGFPLYSTLAESKGVAVAHYPLRPEAGWDIDLDALDALIDDRTAAIVVNNPSNPCGSVYSLSHLKALVALAARRHVPLVADEIYWGMAFPGATFHPLASLAAEADVPVLSVGGLAKQFLVPGWRLGWVTVHDNRTGAFAGVREALQRLSQLILGPNSVLQAALPALLTPTSPEDATALAAFRTETLAALAANAAFLCERLEAVPGLRVVRPAGAMYVMVGLAAGADDVAFAQALLTEENVFVLPGACFGAPGFVRLVFSNPQPVLADACDRIAAFCARRA